MRGQGKTEAQFLWTAVFLTLAGVLLAGCLPGEDRREIDLDDRASDAELRELTARTDTDVLWFGFDLRASPQEDARQYLPFLEYLTKATGYAFELRFTPQDGQIVDDLGTGVVQFAAMGAGSTIQAHAKYGVIPLVRGLNAQGRAEYRSVIVVAPDSSLQTIADLRGKRFAFGSLTSTQGHLIPRIILLQHGLALDDLAAYAYTGSHRNCADEVTAGRFDAGGMQDTLGEELAAAGLLRILSLGVALVLNDVVMPGMGGVALFHALRQRNLAVKVVLLTGHPLEEDMESLRTQGLSDWLPKPPSLEQLAEVVARALES